LLAINVRSVFLTIKEFVLVTKSNSGRIVNISSIAARLPSPGGSLYAASKAAVESLTKSLAVELGHRKITVNAVAPGTTETEMSLHGFSSELLDLNAAVTALEHLGRPDQVADAVVLLCSDAASWITGQSLGADGGQLTTMAVLRRIRDKVELQSKQRAA
jgi:3-oxoacyl-[acyl-carrier protein] reductase